MLDQDPVKVENALAHAMLKEASVNSFIKSKLKSVALLLSTAVLRDLRSKLASVNHYSELSKAYQDLFFNLAAEHTAERRQYGAAMFEVASSKDVINSVPHMHAFLNRLENVINNTDKINTFEEMAIMLKVLVEFGFNYYEAPRDTHSPNFDRINTYVGATTEELDIRLFRGELGQEAKLSISFGIGREEQDLGLFKDGVGRTAGKSVFGEVSMAARLEYTCRMYDETGEKKFSDKMAYYKIPLTKAEREPLSVYAARWETCFEKMMKNHGCGPELPLIASVSRASTRLLVALHDVGAFTNDDGTFNFNTAQIIANCLMAFIVHAGHHSIAEVAEVSNRLYDMAAIEEMGRHNETTLPYYRFGNYGSFFHVAIRDKVMSALNDVELERPAYIK